MDQKKIITNFISKTAMFIVVVGFVTLFSSVFGNENLFVGVGTVTLTLILLQRNLTTNPIRNLLCIIGINVVLGIAAFVAGTNIWLGLVINFVIMFSIGYFFNYELRSPINMLVGLHYLLLLLTPINVERLPMRILALVVGACLLMCVQLVVNKNKLDKVNGKLLGTLQTSIIEKIDLMKEKQSIASINESIEKTSSALKVLIYDGGKKNFDLTVQGKSILNLLACYEEINMLLDTVEDKVFTVAFLEELKNQLTQIEDTSFTVRGIEKQLENMQTAQLDTMKAYKLVNYLKVLHVELAKKNALLSEEKNQIIRATEMPKEFKIISERSKKIGFKGNRMSYGLRLGLLIAITYFIKQLFHLEYGSWLVYTVFALTQPHSEFSVTKSKKRVVGTCLGALIIFVVLSIIKDPSIRTVLMLVIGYMFSYVSDYRNVVVVVTMVSVASAVGTSLDVSTVILNRLFFVGVGIVIAVIANKFILNRTYEDEAKYLDELQEEVTNRFVVEVLMKEEKNESVIHNLYLISTFIDHRVATLNLNVDRAKLHRERKMINNIYCMYLIGEEQHEEVLVSMREMMSTRKIETEKVKKEIKQAMSKVESSRERHVLAMTLTAMEKHGVMNQLVGAH